MPRLDVVGVIVSDLDKAIDFYGRLGLQFPRDPDPEGHGHLETTLPGGLRFTLDTRGIDPVVRSGLVVALGWTQDGDRLPLRIAGGRRPRLPGVGRGRR